MELVKVVLFKADVPAIVIIIELIKVFLDEFIGHVLIDYATVLRVYNEDNALSEHVVVTKHIVNGCLFSPVEANSGRLVIF